MRTFRIDLTQEVRIVVADEFTADYRKFAKAEDATAFLKQANADFPEDDEAFTLAIIKNGLRHYSRNAICQLLHDTPGVGGSVAPAGIEVLEMPREEVEELEQATAGPDDPPPFLIAGPDTPQ